MRASRPRLWFRVLVRIGAAAALLGAVSVPLVAPSIAAAACPSCYGMQSLGENLFVNETMPEGDRRNLQKMMSDAEMPVIAFFGSVSPRRIIRSFPSASINLIRLIMPVAIPEL